MKFKAEGQSLGATDYGAGQTSHRTYSTDARLDEDERWLVIPLEVEHAVSGWTLVGGNVLDATAIAWRFVDKGELPLERDASHWLTEEVHERFGNATGVPCFMTARRLKHFEEATREFEGQSVRAIATVGLSNALTAGDPPGPLKEWRVGTINILVLADRAASQEARFEALAIATEAKALALFEAGITSRLAGAEGRLATGTGTDCVLVAAPSSIAPVLTAAGKHTAFGAAVGAAVHEAVSLGVRAWVAVHGERRKA